MLFEGMTKTLEITNETLMMQREVGDAEFDLSWEGERLGKISQPLSRKNGRGAPIIPVDKFEMSM